MEKFQKSPSGMLQKMKDMEEFCDVTLISDDDKRFRAHKVVLASASTLFRDLFQNYDEETEYQVIHIRGVSSNLIAAMIDLVYDGETKVEERECDEFLKTLKQYKIVKVKSAEETAKIRCNFFNRGYCKNGSECAFDHPREDCETQKVGNVCKDRVCSKRHRVICKYENSTGGCVRGKECMFLHIETNEDVNQVKKTSQKCDACRFENFEKNQVKIHKVKKHKFMLCMKCDKMLEHKEILTTKNFDMKDYLSVKFRDKSLEEIAKMVNY